MKSKKIPSFLGLECGTHFGYVQTLTSCTLYLGSVDQKVGTQNKRHLAAALWMAYLPPCPMPARFSNQGAILCASGWTPGCFRKGTPREYLPFSRGTVWVVSPQPHPCPPCPKAPHLLAETLYLSVDPFLRCRFNADPGVDYPQG